MEKFSENLNPATDITKSKPFLLTELLSWCLILLAIFSCLWRNDCNVLLGLIIVVTLNRNFKLSPGKYSKIIIHILLGLIIIDIIWMSIMFSYWNNSQNEKLYTGTENALHGWVEFIGVLELLVKGGMIFMLFNIYKSFGDWKGLLNFKYN